MSISGIASRSAEAAQAAAESARRAAEEAARRAAEGAQRAGESAQQAVEGAQEVGEKVSSVAAERTRDVYEGSKQAVSGAADKAKEVAGSAADKAREVAGSATDKAREVAGSAADKAKDTWNEVRDVAGAAGKQVQRTAEGIKDTSQDIYHEALRGVEALGGSGQPEKTTQENGAETEPQTLDKALQRLGEGDEVSVKLEELEGDIAGVQVKGAGNVTLSRDGAGKLVVRAGGELGAGVIAAAGGEATGAGGAEGKAGATLNGGAAVELTFDNEQELRRGLETMARSAAVAAAAEASGPLAPVTGAVAQRLVGPSREELSALGNNISAVEFNAGLTGDGSGTLAALGFKAGTQGQVGADATLRLNFNEGQLTDITAREQLHLSNETEAVAGVEGQISGTLEQKFEVPEELRSAEVLRDPSKVTGQLEELRAMDEASLKVRAEGQGFGKYGPVKGAVGGELEVEINGDLNSLQESNSFERLLRGDLPGAVDQAQQDFDVQATLKEYASVEGQLKLSAHGGVAGGAVQASASYKNQHGAGLALDDEALDHVLQQEFQRNRTRAIRG